MHLEDYDAYFGFISRTFIDKSLQTSGDFLVRYGFTSRGRPQFIISVLTAKRSITHVPITFDIMGYWYVCEEKGSTRDGFPNVIALVDYYENNALPGVPFGLDTVYLKNPILRPRWMLHSNLIDMKESKQLGSGNFCVVDKAKYIGFPVAVKTCHSTRNMGVTHEAIEENVTEDARKLEKQISYMKLTESGIPEAQFQLLEEAEVLGHLQHKHIIQLVREELNINFQFIGLCCEKPPLQLVMEFCEGGSLQTHLEQIHESNQIIPDNEMVMYLYEIAQGMEYLESKDMVHRDLACRNILLDKHGVLKVSDFGMAKMAATIYGEDFSHSQIPLHGMAPECLQSKPTFTPKSDIWAYGMLIYEQYNYGAHVDAWKDWPLKKIATYIRRVKMPDPPSNLPGVLRDIVVLKCWVKEPQDRAGFAEIVSILCNLIATKYKTPDENETTLCKFAKLMPPTAEDADRIRQRQNICDGIEEAVKMRKKFRIYATNYKGPKKLKIAQTTKTDKTSNLDKDAFRKISDEKSGHKKEKNKQKKKSQAMLKKLKSKEIGDRDKNTKKRKKKSSSTDDQSKKRLTSNKNKSRKMSIFMEDKDKKKSVAKARKTQKPPPKQSKRP